MHGLSTYLSSRIRAAGHQYCQDIMSMTELTWIKFLKHLYGEVTMYTIYWGLAKFRFGANLPTPDCLSRVARLMMQETTGDPSVLSAACANDPHVPDRILRHYAHCWWDPFDISKNWDGQIATIIKVYRSQIRHMAPAPIPPLVTAHLSDLATEALLECLRSLKTSRTMLDLDTTETLKEVGRTMLLINRVQPLISQVKAEEAEQAEVLMTSNISEAAGVSTEAAAELLRLSKHSDCSM
ncbi:hypothetical protein BKA70DRAFT_1091713 [Coprinopsis sp. MPI-PUGE-AT-0042]|nr:hypothetical protein BKA70DRAFT_1091713 [Coprinopsis sp. MPI-PUGE-AT-0042]